MDEKEQLKKQIDVLAYKIYMAYIDLHILKEQYLEKFPEEKPTGVIFLEAPKKKRGRPKKIIKIEGEENGNI